MENKFWPPRRPPARRERTVFIIVILGIDPGYAIVGYGVLNYENCKYTVLDYGAVCTGPELAFARRLEVIYDGITEVIQKWRPAAVAVEELFFTNNQKTAIGVGQGRGVILLAAQKQGAEIFDYTPLQVKQAVVGYGKAEKKQVMEMTKLLLHLKSVPKPDDTADALALAICHAHASGSRLGGLLRGVR